MKTAFLTLYKTIDKLFKRAADDSLYSYAGHSALFIIISFFPLLMLLLASVKYMPFTEVEVLELINNLPLGDANSVINTVVKEIFARSGSLALSITAITLLWSASTSVYSVTCGLNRIYKHCETRNYFLLRGLSIIYTVIFILSILLALVLMVFGGSIVDLVYKFFPFLKDFRFLITLVRGALSFLIIVFVIDLMYTVIPNRPSKMLRELPGAIIAGIGWYAFSFFYALYIENFSNMSYVYGSLTAIVLLMIYLYILMYILFLGAEINQMGIFKKKKVK